MSCPKVLPSKVLPPKMLSLKVFSLKARLKRWLALALTTAALADLSLTTPLLTTAYAHEVAIEGDVGATLHIEPNDTPKAGEEVLAWFALARPGGETIPLAECDCKLAVYSQPKDRPREGQTPTLAPELSAVDAEGYQNIPGAQLTFPSVGTYTLVINGEPKQAESFTPFSLAFEKTIASGTAISDDEDIEPVPESYEERLENLQTRQQDENINVGSATIRETSAVANVVKWAIAGVATIGLIWISIRLFRRFQ